MYVGHPYNTNIYIPLALLEESLFMDRFQEFSYFLQSLGATKISITNKRGQEIEQMESLSANTQVGIDIGKGGISIASGQTNRDASMNKDNTSQSSKQISRTQVFLPKRKPFLPQNLVWYPHETSWQRLYEQRINGNILTHSEVISTEQHQAVTENEKRNIQQSLQYYVSKANVSHKIETNSMFKQKETTEWVINVEFAPIEELIENTPENKISETLSPDNEQKYIEEIKDMLSDDGKIDDGEKRILERKRQKFGISEEKAKELEEQLTKKVEFTESELKYIEEIKEAIEDSGEITNDDRRLLDRRLSKLGISKERASELEKFVLQGKPKDYTENEMKYIEEIKFCLEDDNEISPKERKMLNNEREDLGISQERAEEIEHEFTKQITK